MKVLSSSENDAVRRAPTVGDECGPAPAPPRRGPPPRLALFTAAFSLALAGVYLLPFLLPPSHAVPSQAYVVGYNNKIAALSLALVSALVFCLSLRGSWPATEVIGRQPSVSWHWLAAALLLAAAWNGLLSWIVYAAHGYAVEDFYILPQLEKFYFLHRHLYSQIEFTYGPLLFYPPVWVQWLLRPFQISLRASYYIALVLNHLAGIAMLCFVVNRLPMPRTMRTAAFLCVSLFSFTPLLGPNYTLMRYMLPIFAFVLFSRTERPIVAAAAAAPAQALIWLDSPELAIAFAASVVACCCYRARRQRTPAWLAPIAASASATAIYLAIVDRNVLASLVSITHGWANRIPLPSLEVLTLLLSTVWIVPRLAARHTARDSPDAGLLLGLYAMGLTLLPASLGLADIVHIAGDSLLLFLLSLVAAAQWRPPARWAWLAAVAATYLLMDGRCALEAHFRFYPDIACIDDRVAADRVATSAASRPPPPLASRLRAFERQWPCETPPLDIAALRAAIGDAPFAAPYPMPEIVEETLPELPNFAPSYWSGTIDLWNDETEQRKVDELRQVEWALLLRRPQATPVLPNINARLSIPTHYRALHPMTWDGVIAQEIDRNWVPSAQIGPYLLYRRIR
jgi:hypothetical protein